MEKCLYHEEFGYYSQTDLPIGKHGDFVTAPHASRFFGSLLAVQITEFIQRAESDVFDICEFGAGAGYLAGDIIAYLKKYEPAWLERLRYFIVEPLERRRQVLEERLSEFRGTVYLKGDFSECGSFKGVILANELLDAFPVHLVQKSHGKFLEVYVDLETDGNFKEVLKEPSTPELKGYLTEIEGMVPDDYRTEVNLAMKEWIRQLSGRVKAGYVMLIDYGFPAMEYLAPHRNRGTLLGYSGQRTTEDFFSFPGMIDITAHVNFSDLRKWAEDYGFKCQGFTPQWAFLGGLDPDETMQRVFGKVDPFSPVLAGIKALIFPHAMGESHKVAVFSKGIVDGGPLKGFRIRDYKDLLK